MPLDPAILKARLGIADTDTSQDPVIAAVAVQAQALAENYCDRAFDLADETEEFPDVASSLQLRRYPVSEVTGLWRMDGQQGTPLVDDHGPDVTSFRIDRARGILWPAGWGCWLAGPAQQLHVEYSGGFDTWPVDLDWAVTAIFDLLWAETPGGGVEAGAGGATAFDAVKRFSVVGAYSVELGSSGDASGGGGGDNTWGLLPPSITSVLDYYRRATRIGIG
jgi:hypothetical protein